jgi:hypothetical protein
MNSENSQCCRLQPWLGSWADLSHLSRDDFGMEAETIYLNIFVRQYRRSEQNALKIIKD